VLIRVREFNWELLNQLIHCGLILVVKWREPNDHFVNQNSNSPPVYCMVMTRVFDNFRSEVFRGATERSGHILVRHFFSKSKISKEEVPVFSHKDVLRLDVTVDNHFLMKISDCSNNLGGIKLGSTLWKSSNFIQMSEQFSSSTEIHNKIDLLL